MNVDIQVRKIRNEDTAEFLVAVQESVDHLSPWLSWCTDEYDVEDAQEFIQAADEEWENRTDYRFIIEEVPTGRVLGGIGINLIVDLYKTGNLGYWVRQSAINCGVCSQAAVACAKLAFTELGLQRLEITIHPDNHASSAVAENIGAEFEGICRNKIILHGQPAPAKCYSLIPSDFNL